MKNLRALYVTAFAFVFALSITACTESLTGPEYNEQLEQTESIHTLDARHNLDPAANNQGDGGDLMRNESHNRVDE